MKLKLVICGAVVACLAGTAALTHGGATGIVKERMDGMGVMGKAIKQLALMMQGQTEYDANVIRNAAENLGQHSGQNLTKLFPEGTGGKPSEAKSEIWENWDSFAKIADELEQYSKALSLAADNGLASENTQSTTSMMGTSTSENTMLGTSAGLMGNSDQQVNIESLAAMPADDIFNLLSRTCSECHTLYRAEGG
jgi:cytochrome c556